MSAAVADGVLPRKCSQLDARETVDIIIFGSLLRAVSSRIITIVVVTDLFSRARIKSRVSAHIKSSKRKQNKYNRARNDVVYVPGQSFLVFKLYPFERILTLRV